MKTPPKHLFKVKSMGPAIAPAELERDLYPAVGDELTVFNFPDIERYRIERFDPRPEHWEHDWYEPVAIVVSSLGVVQSAKASGNVVLFNATDDLRSRLAVVVGAARRTVTENLELEICHSDFLELCRVGDLPAELSQYDAFAYEGIPMALGEAGAQWNVATSFAGYSDDRHVLYVTLPSGAPFVMNGGFLSMTRGFNAGRVKRAELRAHAVDIASASGTALTEAVSHGLINAIDLLVEGLLPPYDAAQELTRVVMPSESAKVESAWQARQRAEQAGATKQASGNVPVGLTLEKVLVPKVPANQA